MPQGLSLGHLIFIIDDLKPSCIIYKFMDDVTLSEVIRPTSGSDPADSNISHYINRMEHWPKNYIMDVNFKKTKEMIIGSIQKILHSRFVLVKLLT